LLERWATAPSVAETVERFKPTVMLSVPAVYHRLLDAGLAPTPAFRALRHYVSAGGRLPPQIWSAWEAASGHPILDGLGCSELVYMVIGNTPQRRRPGSSGLAMPGVELRIVDEAGTVLAEPGETGRLEIRMPSVCAGYRAAGDKPGDPPHQPEERFRPDGWFATGDEYLQDPDGFYHHRGRAGDMLRVSGIWISPAEIEDVLAGIRSISETAAVLGESEIGLAEIVLYIVPAPGADGSAAVGRARTAVAGSAAHGDRQGPAQQASRATAARPALTPWTFPSSVLASFRASSTANPRMYAVTERPAERARRDNRSDRGQSSSAYGTWAAARG
jgi:benzoate-CoA ligase